MTDAERKRIGEMVKELRPIASEVIEIVNRQEDDGDNFDLMANACNGLEDAIGILSSVAAGRVG